MLLTYNRKLIIIIIVDIYIALIHNNYYALSALQFCGNIYKYAMYTNIQCIQIYNV